MKKDSKKIDRNAISPQERAMIDLASGSRKPKNKGEEKLLNQIKEIKAQGYILDIPAVY